MANRQRYMCAPRKPVPPMIRAAIVADRTMGMSVPKIVEVYKIPKSTVYRILDKFDVTGDYMVGKSTGRPRKLDERTDRIILNEVKKDGFVNLKSIQKVLIENGLVKYGHTISLQTIRNRIYASGDFECYMAAQKPLLRHYNRVKRLHWCLQHKHWTVEQWRKVIWTDESPFTLRFNCKRKVLRMKGERYEEKNCAATVKQHDKVMVWGCFAHHSVGDLHWIKKTMDQSIYKQILIHHFRPSAQRLFPDNDFIFQQDNDPKHTAKSVKIYLQNSGLQILTWVTQSPDLNPIENLWARLNWFAKDRKCNDKEGLMQILQEAWNTIPIDLLSSLVDSMPRRILAVIDAEGGLTKY